MGKPTTARGRATRQALLDAAEEVFGEKGFDKAAITAITKRAGVSQGTFYVYFANKKEIFTELVSHLGTALRRALREATQHTTTRLEAEELGIRAFLAFLAEHRNLYRIVRQAEFVDEAVFRAYYTRFAEGYRSSLRHAQKQGEVGDLNLEALAYALMGISDFLGIRWVLWEQTTPPEDAIQTILHLLRHGIGPTETK